VRSNLYTPFESGQLSTSSDVYVHEIPGGQFTNLLYQSRQLGLTSRWPEIKAMYATANQLLGDIPKVTPSSKVVGDLAQFMVAQGLTAEQLVEQAESLPLPDSVIQYFQGTIGVPPGGFPEPLRTNVLKGRPLADGRACFDGRPGATMDAYGFDEATARLKTSYGERFISNQDVMSDVMYPAVFEEWRDYASVYGDVGELPTHLFLKPLEVGEEVDFEIEKGRSILIKLVSKGEPDEDGIRECIMELNGERWFTKVTDQNVESLSSRREKATGPGQVGSPMPGVIVKVGVNKGDKVAEGDQVAVLSAMKMETVILAPASGTVTHLTVSAGDKVEGDDLLCTIE